jgi:hypothetical protein
MGLMSFFVRLGLDATQFKSALVTAQSAGQKFARDIKREIGGNIAAAFTVGAVTAFAKSVINAADEIGDLSDQLNITTDDVQRLQILAGQTGVSFEAMASAINKVNEARQKAMSAPGAERAAFDFLGIGMATLSDKQITNLDLVRKIGQGYQDGGKSIEKQAAVADLLGSKLVKAANAVADIDKLGDISIISDKDLQRLGDFNNRLDEISRMAKVITAPALGLIAEEMKKIANESDSFAKVTGRGPQSLQAALLARSLKASPMFNLLSKVAESALSKFPQRQNEPIGPDQGPEFIPFEGPMPEDGGPIKKPTLTGRLQMSSDPLARIGGFTAFGVAQDRAARELIMQTRLLRNIERATVATAKEMANP